MAEQIDWLIYLLTLLGSYFVGSFPTGWVLGKLLKNIDIREYGSGNTGFSNVYRILGKTPAIITIFVDIAVKGACVAWASRLIIGFLIIETPSPSNFVYTLGFTEPIPQMFVALSGLFAIIGHNWPIWLKFKGGKGMATTAGIFLSFVPVTFVALLVVWLLVVIITRYTSLANILTTPALPLFIFLETNYIMRLDIITSLPLIIGGFIAGILLLWSHRENIKRLISHTERKFGDKSERIDKEEEKNNPLSN